MGRAFKVNRGGGEVITGTFQGNGNTSITITEAKTKKNIVVFMQSGAYLYPISGMSISGMSPTGCYGTNNGSAGTINNVSWDTTTGIFTMGVMMRTDCIYRYVAW